MGYESCGDGIIHVRELYDVGFTVETLRDMGFDIEKQFRGPGSARSHRLSFQGARIYNWDEEFRYLIDTCNGELSIEGENRPDIWKLRFRDGKIEACTARIKYTAWKPVELEKVL